MPHDDTPPTPSPEQEPLAPRPTPPTLDYRPVHSREPGVAGWQQALLGLLAYFLAVGLGAAIASLLNLIDSSEAMAAIVTTAIVAPIAALVVATRYVRRRFGWRSFLPGILIGFGLTALLYGLCWVVVLISFA
jgi:hypothetical protein